MNTIYPSTEDWPVCPECGKHETYVARQNFPTRSYWMFHCEDERCGLFERTHSIEVRPINQESA